MNRKRIFSILVITLFTSFSFGQTRMIDSLRVVITNEKTDTTRIKLLIDLAWELADYGDYEKGLIAGEKAKHLAEESNYKKGLSEAYNIIGVIGYYRGDFASALENYLSALKIEEETGNKKGIAYCLNNIGTIYHDQQNYHEALKNYHAALKIREEIGDKPGVSYSLNNIGIIYREQGKYDDALKNYFASLKIKEELGDKFGVASALNNIGNVYTDLRKYNDALNYHLASLKIEEELGNTQGIGFSLNSIGNIYTLKGDPYTGKEWQKKSLKISEELGSIELMTSCYSSLVQADSALGDYKSAFENHKKYILYRDSLNAEENSKRTIQLEMQYEFDIKEQATKLEQEKKDLIHQSELNRQILQRNAFIAGFSLALVLALVSYRSYKSKQKANEIIKKQKEEVERQKIIVEEKNREIVDSIEYAKRLQEAILPPLKLVKEVLPDSFILYKPKDIVAGDFYWLDQGNDLILFAAADCTGHGVPGAMVSVVCSNALNRAVKEFGIIQPGKILDKVRELVIETFEKSESEVKDGMDVSLVSMNTRTGEVQWAGANNPLWIIVNDVLTEYKPDKQPIGKYELSEPFTTHSIRIEKNSSLYIFTDGYADQFGGFGEERRAKKFKSNNFKKLLLSIQKETMDNQKKIIADHFEEWKGDMEQIDDVCVIGVKF